MATAKKAAPKAENTPKMELVKSADFTSAYSNNANVSISNWDLVLMFGESTGTVGGVLHVEQKVRVTMSLQHAKAFASVLNDNLKKYEELFGEIIWQPKASVKSS